MLSITVEDSGQGFDYRRLLSVPEEQMSKGLRRLMKMSDELEFENVGNKVTARCRWYLNNQ